MVLLQFSLNPVWFGAILLGFILQASTGYDMSQCEAVEQEFKGCTNLHEERQVDCYGKQTIKISSVSIFRTFNPGCMPPGSSCWTTNVTSYIANACDGKTSCTFKVSYNSDKAKEMCREDKGQEFIYIKHRCIPEAFTHQQYKWCGAIKPKDDDTNENNNNNNNNNDKDKNNRTDEKQEATTGETAPFPTGIVAGVVAGALVLVVLAVIGTYFVMKKRREKAQEEGSESSITEAPQEEQTLFTQKAITSSFDDMVDLTGKSTLKGSLRFPGDKGFSGTKGSIPDFEGAKENIYM